MAKAVLLEGNSYYLNSKEEQKYRDYYNKIKDHLRRVGYDDVVSDPAIDYTQPPDADLWVGHSRGAGMLWKAPEGTRTLDITKYEGGYDEYNALMAREMERLGYKSVRDFPVEERPRPGPEHYTLTDRAIKAIEDHGVKTSQVLAHIAGPSGSGKTTLLNALQKKHKDSLVTKDLDEFDEEAEGLLGYSDTRKNDYTDEMLLNLANKRQELMDTWVAQQDKPVVLGGFHTEADHVLDIPTENKYTLATSPLTSAWRAYRRDPEHRSLYELPLDYSDAKRDAEQLREWGYAEHSPEEVENMLASQLKTASEQDFAPDFTPEQLKELGVYDQVYGDAPSEASMKEWPEHWINEQDPLGWLQWYDRYSEGRRTDDDSRQIKRWKSFKARHLAQYIKNPTPRRAAALRNWGIDVSNQEKLSELTKESKSRIVKHIEQLIASGQKEKALEMLKKVESSEGIGSYAAKEIKGITDNVLGRGQYGRVSDAFYGGQVVPAKKLVAGPKANRALVEQFQREGQMSSNIERIVKEDAALRRLVDTPSFLAGSKSNPNALVGQSRNSVANELAELRKIDPKLLTKQQKGRISQLERNVRTQGESLGSGQAMPMSRVDFGAKPSLSSSQVHQQRLRAAKARQIITDRYGVNLTDLNPGAANENMVYARVGGKPVLVDFGIWRGRDWKPNTLYDGIVGPQAINIRNTVRNRSVDSLAPSASEVMQGRSAQRLVADARPSAASPYSASGAASPQSGRGFFSTPEGAALIAAGAIATPALAYAHYRNRQPAPSPYLTDDQKKSLALAAGVTAGGLGAYGLLKEGAPGVKTASEGTATKRDPKKWSAAKSRAKAKMGGKWSARAAQLAVKYYKDSGGSYSGKKPTKKNNKLKKWTKEEWGYRPGSKAEKDSKKSPSSGTKGRYLPKKKWKSLSKSEQKATDAKKRKGMKKGKGVVANTAKAKYDSKKDYTKKSMLADAIIKNASAALVGGYVGSQVAGKDNTIAGAATGAALGKGTALATYGWHSQPMLRGILGDAHMNKYVKPGSNLWQQSKGAFKAGLDPAAAGKIKNWYTGLGTLQGWKDSGKAILGQNLRKGAIGIGAGLVAGVGAKYLGWGENATEKTSSQQLYGILGNAAAGAVGGYASSGENRGGQGAAIGALAGAIGGKGFSKWMDKRHGKGVGQALNLFTLGTPAMAAGGIASSLATDSPVHYRGVGYKTAEQRSSWSPAQYAGAAAAAAAAAYGGYKAYQGYNRSVQSKQESSYMPYVAGAGLLAAGILGRGAIAKGFKNLKGRAPLSSGKPNSAPLPAHIPPAKLEKYRKLKKLQSSDVSAEAANALKYTKQFERNYPGIEKFAFYKLAMSINSKQYPEGVSPRFQGYISQKRTKLTTPISDLPKPPPPANDSEKTRNELLVIKMHMEEGKLPESLMILADREPEKIFYIACEKFGIDPKKEQAAVIKEDFNKIAFDLKYLFKRPRPWSLSDYHGVNLNVTVPESADTPSYPSGHAMMGYGLAEFYKTHYPEYSKQWDGIADIIQHSRLQSGVHFPSDTEYARRIVMEVSNREKVSSVKTLASSIKNLSSSNLHKVAGQAPVGLLDDLAKIYNSSPNYKYLVNPMTGGALVGGFTGGMQADNNKVKATLVGAGIGAALGKYVSPQVAEAIGTVVTGVRNRGLDKIRTAVQEAAEAEAAAAELAQEVTENLGVLGRAKAFFNKAVNPVDSAANAAGSAAQAGADKAKSLGLNAGEYILSGMSDEAINLGSNVAGRLAVGAGLTVPSAMLAGHLVSGDSRMNKLASAISPPPPSFSNLYGLIKNSEEHSESRRKERAAHIPKKRLDSLKKSIKDKQSKIPEGTHHVRLDNATAVIKDVGNKHVLATVLGPNMKAPGKDLHSTLL